MFPGLFVTAAFEILLQKDKINMNLTRPLTISLLEIQWARGRSVTLGTLSQQILQDFSEGKQSQEVFV